MFFKKKDSQNTFLVVGLGNPGREYERSRHNCGYQALDAFAARHGVSVKRARFRSLAGELKLGGARLILLKPTTYMNLSGVAVHEAAAFYKVAPANVITVSDDVALEPGMIRIRAAGSAGGQKGLKNIIAALHTDEFPRVRIGVGAPPNPGYDMADWVLGKPTPAEQKKIDARMDDVCDAIELIAAGELAEAQSRFN